VAGSPYLITATLSPAGPLANYTITYNTALFTINKATASVTPTAASKTYGAADPVLSGTLSGFMAADAVTAAYSRTAGEAAGGSYVISAVLSPAAPLANYTITYNTAPFTINKATASVTPNAASKIYGQPDPLLTGTLSGFQASDGVSATYTRAPGENVVGSPYLISATLSPSSVLANYSITYNTAGLTITPATPIITWANPSDITYPTPLSGMQLNATANVPGTFAYTPPSGAVLNVGNGQPLSVLLSPTDSSNYTTATAQVSINVLPSDVAIVETTPTPTIMAGDTAVYNLVVTSDAQGSASNVVLTDTLPAGLNWTVSGDGGACGVTSPATGGTTLNCNFGALAPGATLSITLTAVTTNASCDGLVNSATVSSTGDTNASNNSSGPVGITVYCPTLAISKTAAAPTISAGDTATYNVTVTSGGTGNVTNVVMTDTLPAGLTWALTGPDAGACTPASQIAGGTALTCSFGTMAPGARKQITLSAATTAANCGIISNTATVTATGDTTPGDNSAGPVPITVYCPDVSVALSTSTSFVNAGSTASYTVIVKGNGPGTSNNVVLTDTLPVGLNWTVGGTDAAACAPSVVTGGMTLSCSFGSLVSGATKTITLIATTSTANCGTMNDTATVTSTGDTNPGNNSSGPVPITVNCQPVSVTLTCPNVNLEGTALAVSGTITPASASSVTIQYTSPSGVTTAHTAQSTATGSYADSFAATAYGPWTVQASWNGAQSPACPVVVFGKSTGGTFVIGDGNAVLGNTVDFWGSQWWKDNTWSGGVNPGVASLKGYLDAVDLPGGCGGSWSTRPGNSSKPPATVPDYLAVVVSSTITKNGSTISGDVVAEVIVDTNPGYAGDPGHEGTGKIIAVICHK
jgi:uncharacterized repeat protein (TIGR01451 family)